MKFTISLCVLFFAWTAKATVQLPVLDTVTRISTLKFVTTIPLKNKTYPLFHPQGVKVIGDDVYVSTVEGTSTGFGHVIKFKLDSATAPKLAIPTAQITFDPGKDKQLIHSGGIDRDNDSLIVPLAEYNSRGPGLLIRVDLKNFGTYKVMAHIDDHIGTVINDETSIYSMNWDSKKIYGYDKATNRSNGVGDGNGWNYQDCKNVAPTYALCSALKGHLIRNGEIHLVHISNTSPNIQIVNQIKVGKFNSDGTPGGGRPLTNNAMDFAPILNEAGNRVLGVRFYFIPHDGNDARLMIYDSMI